MPNGGNPWQEGACNFTYMSKQYAIKYIVTIVFDFVVMILTVVGVVRMSGGSRIGAVLIKQGLQYLLATFLINALVAGLTLANLNPVMSLIGAIPSATVCVMCSTRLYVHLAEEAKPKPEGVTSSQLSSSFTSSGAEKIAKFFRRESQNPPNSFALRSTESGNGTAVGGVESLSYTVKMDGSHSPVDGKSFGMVSNEDLERGRGMVIKEERTVVQEPMLEHLAAMLSNEEAAAAAARGLGDHPYASESVKGHFPRLSKS